MMRSVPASSPAPYRPLRNSGSMYVARRLAGEAVGDPRLEAVADLDPDAALLQRHHDQQAVVLALLADAAAVVLEQLVRVLADVAEGLEGRHGRDDDDVAGRGLELADHLVHRGRAGPSMTCAKSLTGSVSSGSCAAGVGPQARATSVTADERTRARQIAARRGAGETAVHGLPPSVHERDDPLDGVEVRRDQPARRVGRDLADAGERDDVRDRAGGRARRALGVPRGRRRRRRVSHAVEARQRLHEPRERRRRIDDEDGERVGAAARLDVALRAGGAGGSAPALRTRAAGPPDRRDAVERVASGGDDVVGDDRAELERESVERPLELVRREEERRREARAVPGVDAGGARLQIRGGRASRRRRACERRAARRCAPVACRSCRRRAPCRRRRRATGTGRRRCRGRRVRARRPRSGI